MVGQVNLADGASCIKTWDDMTRKRSDLTMLRLGELVVGQVDLLHMMGWLSQARALTVCMLQIYYTSVGRLR